MSGTQSKLMQFGNRMVSAVLASPFHSLLSGSTLVIQLHGRHSGKVISTPVNYLEEGDHLWVGSERDRSWWKNARGETHGKVLLRRKWQDCLIETIEEPEAATAAFEHLFQLNPGLARYYKVHINAAGIANSADLELCGISHVMIKVTLDGASNSGNKQ